MSDSISIMKDGLIIQTTTPEALYETPASRYVADFIGESNLFAGTVLLLESGRVVLSTDAGLVREIRLRGRVEDRIYLGNLTEYRVRTDAFGIVYGYLPLMVFPIYVTLEKLDKRLLEASGDLGAS